MKFARHIGIDYSGRGQSSDRTPALQIYLSENGLPPKKVRPLKPNGSPINWSRQTLFEWLSATLLDLPPTLVGIDHGFSFPESYFQRYRLQTWDEFLNDFVQHWPTHLPGTTVEDFRPASLRCGHNTELRLTEKWTSSAKSVFQFDVQGSVAKSTHAGLPWLRELRHQNKQIHFWPFDGWKIPRGHHVLAEVYPAIFSKRFERADRSADEQDAFAVANWLCQTDGEGILDCYLQPPLSAMHQEIAMREGWILGIV